MRYLPSIHASLGFGQYGKLAVTEIAEINPGYIKWLHDNDVIQYTELKDKAIWLELVIRALSGPQGRVIRSIHDALNFGKYNGWRFSTVAHHDPRYFTWLLRNRIIRCLDPRVEILERDAATEAAEIEARRRRRRQSEYGRPTAWDNDGDEIQAFDPCLSNHYFGDNI